MVKELTNQEKIFVMEYLADVKMNPEQAALKAGYSKSMARTKAFTWVSKSKQNKKPHVAEYIERIIQKRIDEYKITEERIVIELARIAFANLPRMIEDMERKAEIEKLMALTEDQQTAIQEIHADGKELHIKLYPKFKALELLMKRFAVKTEKESDRVPRVRVVKNDTELQDKRK